MGHGTKEEASQKKLQKPAKESLGCILSMNKVQNNQWRKRNYWRVVILIRTGFKFIYI